MDHDSPPKLDVRTFCARPVVPRIMGVGRVWHLSRSVGIVRRDSRQAYHALAVCALRILAGRVGPCRSAGAVFRDFATDVGSELAEERP